MQPVVRLNNHFLRTKLTSKVYFVGMLVSLVCLHNRFGRELLSAILALKRFVTSMHSPMLHASIAGYEFATMFTRSVFVIVLDGGLRSGWTFSFSLFVRFEYFGLTAFSRVRAVMLVIMTLHFKFRGKHFNTAGFFASYFIRRYFVPSF